MREKCPKSLHDYWNFREELTIEDGLIIKCECMLIPNSLREEILGRFMKDIWDRRSVSYERGQQCFGREYCQSGQRL